MSNEVLTAPTPDQFFSDIQDTDPETMKNLVSAAKAFGIEKDIIKKLDGDLKKRKADHKDREALLFAMFEVIGITAIKADGRTYFTKIDTYAAIDAGNEEAAFKWIKEIGCDYLIAEKVNAQSLTREVKAYIEGGGNKPTLDQGIKMRTENRVGAPKG